MSALRTLPQFSRPLVLCIAALLLFCRCCHADKVRLSDFSCAKMGTVVNGFKATDDGGLLINSSSASADMTLFGFQKSADGQLSIDLFVQEACVVNSAEFSFEGQHCDHGQLTDATNSADKCPAVGGADASVAVGCKTFTVLCKDIPVREVAEEPKSGLFKINIGELTKIPEGSCGKWTAYVKDVRQVLDYSSEDGEPCVRGGAIFPIWAIVLSVLILLIIGGVATGLVVWRQRMRAKKSAVPETTEKESAQPTAKEATVVSTLLTNNLERTINEEEPENEPTGMKHSYTAMGASAAVNL